MNNGQYSAYPDEQEVLLYDGVAVTVEQVDYEWRVPEESRFSGA